MVECGQRTVKESLTALATHKYQAIDDLFVMHPDMPGSARRWLEARRDQLFIENNP